MNYKIIVFTSNPTSFKEGFIVSKFNDVGYFPLVDSVNKNNYYWFVKNFTSNYRFYNLKLDNTLFDYTVEDLSEEMYYNPNFVISFNNDDELDSEDWNILRDYLNSIFSNTIDNLTIEKRRRINNLIPLIEAQKKEPETKDVEIETKLPDYYELRYEHIVEKDAVIYEVKKPLVDLPYTTIVRNFKKNGHVPFFTNLFICPSWGVCKEDIGFLKNAWKSLLMDGEFNLESLMKAATEKCYPSSDTGFIEPEPEVYRRNMDEVLQRLQRMQNGLTE